MTAEEKKKRGSSGREGGGMGGGFDRRSCARGYGDIQFKPELKTSPACKDAAVPDAQKAQKVDVAVRPTTDRRARRDMVTFNRRT